MKIIFESEAEKEKLAIKLSNEITMCPEFFIGEHDMCKDSITCMDCWMKALDKMEVKPNER